MAAGAQILAWLGRAAGCRASLPLAVAGHRAPAGRHPPGPRGPGVYPGRAAHDTGAVGSGAGVGPPVAAPDGPRVTMVCVADTLHLAMERGTQPAAWGRKPGHGTSTLKAAMGKASRAWQDTQPRCRPCWQWQTTVRMCTTDTPFDRL